MAKVLGTADVIVVGGGVAGLSSAMQLARRGKKVIGLERQTIGAGSTGRAAGLLGQLRGTAAATRMLVEGLEIVRGLERDAGARIFVQTGSLRIGETAERAQEIHDLVEMARSIGFGVELISKARAAELLPYMRCDDLLAACYCATDGHLQPAELAAGYLKVGKALGVSYRTQCPITSILTRNGAAFGVACADGEYHAPVVLNAAGPWSYLVADFVQAKLPTAAIGHYYLTTRPDPAHPVDRHSPAVRNRHHRIYTRPEAGGLLVGIYEAEPVEYDMESLPADFDMSQMKAARDSLNVALLIDAAHQRFPWIDERTPMAITTGIMTFTPDGRPFCGAMPDLRGLYYCTGFSGHGIVQSPAIGLIMAELICDGRSRFDLAGIEADRYFDIPELRNRAEIKRRCHDMYASYYGRVEGKSAAPRARKA